jgi:hypothetical protein
MVVYAAIVSLMPGWVVSVYTNDASLVAASVPSVYVIVGSLLIGSVANVAFNGVSGTGIQVLRFLWTWGMNLYVLKEYVEKIR